LATRTTDLKVQSKKTGETARLNEGKSNFIPEKQKINVVVLFGFPPQNVTKLPQDT